MSRNNFSIVMRIAWESNEQKKPALEMRGGVEQPTT